MTATPEAATAKAEPKRTPPAAKLAPVIGPTVVANSALLGSLDGHDLAGEEARAEAFADRVQPGGRPSSSDYGREPLAVTRGRSIELAGHAPGAGTAAGRWLIAHELAHVVQQRTGPSRARAYVPGQTFHDPDGDLVSDVPGAIPKDVMDPTSGLDVDQVVDIAAPLLSGQKKKGDNADQRWHLHSSAIAPLIPLSAFAIPRSKLTLDPEGLRPAAADAPVQPAVGGEVYAPGHLKLAVLGSDAANIIVEGSGAIHYGVGAGSCVLVQTNSGFYLFDAGINKDEGDALANAMADKIVAHLKGEPIRGVFLTHAHFDHVGLLKRLAKRVQIDAVVANPLQLTRDKYLKIRDAIKDADLKRRTAETVELRNDAAEREKYLPELEKKGSDRTLNEMDAEAEWHHEVVRRVAERFPQMKEVPALPIEGRRGLEFDTTGTHPLHQMDQVETDFDLADILPEKAGELRGVVDPSMHRRMDKKLGKNNREVDSMSTTWILTIDGRRLVMMPDLRRTDVHELKKELTDALGDRVVDFQEWVLGHHLQAGFLDQGSKGRIVRAETLRATLELLHDFRAKGRDGVKGRDAVIASVDPSKVDPAQIRLLRLLGFETYMARSQADVHTYVVLAGGKLLRGVKGPLAPGAEGEATLQRAIVGEKALKRQQADLVREQAKIRGKGSPALKAEKKKQIDALQSKIVEISGLQDAVVDAARAKSFDPAKLSEAEAKLNTALDAAGIGKVVTSSSQITDTALVLLREELEKPEPGTRAAEQRARDLELRRQKSLVDELRERARNVPPEAREDAYAELYAEMAQYESLLAQAKETHGTGITSQIAEAEQARIRAERAALEHSLHGERQAARLPDGRLVDIDNKVVKISPGEHGGGEIGGPSPLARTMLKGLGHIGRAMGAVMVISTVRGERELIESYEHGQASLAQLGLGTTKAVASGVVSLRMLTGAHVPSVAFAMISVLEIGEAIAGDYDSATEQNRAIDTTVRNGAVSTGCMGVGEALIDTGHPLAILAGAAIMFLGPVIINAIFGDDTPEALYPDAIKDVDETLVMLVNNYETVIGDISFAKMSPETREKIGLAESTGTLPLEWFLVERRKYALVLEARIMDEFEEAYGVAREGRAGLRELDEMRRRFLALRARASTDETDEEARSQIEASYPGGSPGVPEGFLLERQYDANNNAIPIRELTMRRFKAIEASLSLDKLTAKQVHDMAQWKSIKQNAIDLIEQVMKKQALDPDWKDIGQRQRDLEARVASARYRLDPRAQSDPKSPVRDVPLLSPGTDARKAYEEELAHLDRWVRDCEEAILSSHWINFQAEGVRVDTIQGLPLNSDLTGLDRQLEMAADGLRLYARTVEEIGGPPPVVGDAERLYREPSARAVYLAQIEANRPFRKSLTRLQVNETAVRSILQSLATQIAGEPPTSAAKTKLSGLQAKFRRMQNDRRERRGILFAEEIQARGARENERALAFYGPKLGAKPDDPVLTTEQITALRSGDYGDAGTAVLGNRRTLLERLQRIPDLRIPTGPTSATDSTGTVMHESRELHGIMRLDGLYRDDVLLVGVVGSGRVPGMVNVVALNDAAVEILGGFATAAIAESRLLPATEDDLAP